MRDPDSLPPDAGVFRGLRALGARASDFASLEIKGRNLLRLRRTSCARARAQNARSISILQPKTTRQEPQKFEHKDEPEHEHE